MELLQVYCPKELNLQAAEALQQSKEKCKNIEVNLTIVKSNEDVEEIKSQKKTNLDCLLC